MAPLDIVIITNSPGELSSWVRATVRALREQAAEARIVVMLVPCPFASGNEANIARSFPEVDLVLSPRDFIRCGLGLSVAGFKPAQQGVVAFLGGDFWHALLIANRLHYPTVAYGARGYRWSRWFSRTCLQDDAAVERLAQWGVPRARLRNIGNLVAEAVRPQWSRQEALQQWQLDAEALTVGILPGSRFGHARVSLPVFLKAAEELTEVLPRIQFLVGQSPFLTEDELRRCLVAPGRGAVPGVEGRLADGYIETPKGLRIRVVRGQQYDLMNVADLLFCIPGTNTAEAASMGVPMLVCMTWKAPVPQGGLGALTGLLPMYSGVRRHLLKATLKRLRFVALPNIQAGRPLIPEICVEESSREIVDVARPLLTDGERRASLGAELKQLFGAKGAAAGMAMAILQTAQEMQHDSSREPGGVKVDARVGL
ncbi:MAG: glycosyltransferase family protein [Candidatus Xenobia bacterium]